MTGFGKAVTRTTQRCITVEIKSLNSKQLDLSVRLPQCLRSIELDIRAMIAAKLERGKVEMFITLERTAAEAVMNMDALGRVRQAIATASRELSIPEPSDWWSVLMRFPEVTSSPVDAASDIDESLQHEVTDTVSQAIDKLLEHRRAEGIKLEDFFEIRLTGIAELLSQVAKFENERVEKIRQRLTENLSKMSTIDIDKGRLEQEMIFYIEKLDVNEEKQRLAQHISYFRETMSLPTPGQGKKLGFIAQEMGREINTLGSKSNQADMQQIVVRMKDLLEQIKEQVLNVM